MIFNYNASKGPSLACIILSNEKCDIALVQKKKNIFYLSDYQTCVFKHDILCKGYIFNMTILSQYLQKIFKEFRISSSYFSLSCSNELVQESLDAFNDNTICNSQLLVGQHRYHIGIRRTQLFQYQLLSSQLNRPCIVLTSQISCLLQIARYFNITIPDFDSLDSLHSFLVQTFSNMAPHLIVSSHELEAHIKMIFAGLYVMSTSR